MLVCFCVKMKELWKLIQTARNRFIKLGKWKVVSGKWRVDRVAIHEEIKEIAWSKATIQISERIIYKDIYTIGHKKIYGL